MKKSYLLFILLALLIIPQTSIADTLTAQATGAERAILIIQGEQPQMIQAEGGVFNFEVEPGTKYRLMIIGTAPGNNQTELNVAGSWTMYYDWDCNGTNDWTTWILREDHSFYSVDSESTGSWYMDGTSITIVYDSGTTYSGEVESEDYMSGTMVAHTGMEGCWFAEKRSNYTNMIPADEKSQDTPNGGLNCNGD